jgi:nitronate monooxygenase
VIQIALGEDRVADANREVLLPALNELLEAERAGAQVTLASAKEAGDPALKALIMDVHRDEARWCGVLLAAIKQLEGEASPKTGDFYGRSMAIEDMDARLAFLNRGQAWVVRKLQALLPAIEDAHVHAELTEMLVSHEANIARVAVRLPPAPAS